MVSEQIANQLLPGILSPSPPICLLGSAAWGLSRNPAGEKGGIALLSRGAETLPVASLACDSSLEATGCREAKARPHSCADALGLRAALWPVRWAPRRNGLPQHVWPGA